MLQFTTQNTTPQNRTESYPLAIKDLQEVQKVASLKGKRLPLDRPKRLRDGQSSRQRKFYASNYCKISSLYGLTQKKPAKPLVKP
jgi:hypothetical protein